MSKLDTKIISEKLEEVFNKPNSAAKINIALGFVLRNIETGPEVLDRDCFPMKKGLKLGKYQTDFKDILKISRNIDENVS